MGANTKIQWTEQTWNPTVGCSKLSPGCAHCYAIPQAHRMASNPNPKIQARYGGTTERKGSAPPNWSGVVRLDPAKLDEPMRRKQPTMYFVNSMSDLFHESLPDQDIAAIFGIMALTPQHTYQVLTKRADRLPAWFRWLNKVRRGYLHEHVGYLAGEVGRRLGEAAMKAGWRKVIDAYGGEGSPKSIGDATAWPWPLPNVWLGVSCEDQQRADERIPHLLSVPAAVQFVSAEPLLGRIDCSAWLSSIDWLIAGGESGPRARPCDLAWLRSIRDQCEAKGVAFFCKQLGARIRGDDWGPGKLPMIDTNNNWVLADPKGGDWSEWPEDLRVREFPEVVPA